MAEEWRVLSGWVEKGMRGYWAMVWWNGRDETRWVCRKAVCPCSYLFVW
jgi:hypothetical protein